MIRYRQANIGDVKILYEWANEEVSRQNSFSSDPISYESHCRWFEDKLASSQVFFYLYYIDDINLVGQVRIDKQIDNTAVISISVQKNHRAKGYGTMMINMAAEDFLKKNKTYSLLAYIKKENAASLRSFTKAGFILKEEIEINGISSVLLKRIDQ
jgi:L-amino acid N-acyltransferase YncA